MSTAYVLIDHIKLKPPKVWLRALDENDSNAYLALTIGLLPDLLSLYVEGDLITNPKFLDHSFQQALQTGDIQMLPKYNRLQSLRLNCTWLFEAFWEPITLHDFNALYSLFHLPFVTDLEVQLPDADFWCFELPVTQGSRRPTRLALSSCQSSATVLERLLSDHPPVHF